MIFSHYQYFDQLLDHVNRDWCERERVCYVWQKDRFIPYPYQNNIHRCVLGSDCLQLSIRSTALCCAHSSRPRRVPQHKPQHRLPKEDLQKCMEGLIALEKQKGAAGVIPKPNNFLEWLQQGFGQGILDLFLVPYNRKVWGYDPSEMNTEWMGERVATVDLARITSNILSVRVCMYVGMRALWSGQPVGETLKAKARHTAHHRYHGRARTTRAGAPTTPSASRCAGARVLSGRTCTRRSTRPSSASTRA